MAVVATISTSHPLPLAGIKGPLWIIDRWLKSFGRSALAKKPPLSNRSSASQTTRLERIMPLSALSNVAVLVRVTVGPSGPATPVGPVGPTGPGGPAVPGGPAAPAGPGSPVRPGSPAGPGGPGGPGGPVGPGSPKDPSDVSLGLQGLSRRMIRPFFFSQNVAMPSAFTATRSPTATASANIPVVARSRFGPTPPIEPRFAI